MEQFALRVIFGADQQDFREVLTFFLRYVYIFSVLYFIKCLTALFNVKKNIVQSSESHTLTLISASCS